MNISPLASVHPDAQLGSDVTVGPFAVIYGNVVIGAGTTVHSHAVIYDGARIGTNCQIFQGASVSSLPQDLKFGGEDTKLVIGDNSVIREFCTLNRGTAAHGTTSIGSDCLLMAYVHVAHDCQIGNNVVIVNSVNLGGHIEIGDHAILGGNAQVHQFVKIGQHSMISGGSLVRKDVPPYVKAAREPLSFVGVNGIGLKRRGFTTDQVAQIQNMYRFLFVKGYNTAEAVKKIQEDVQDSPERKVVLDFLAASDRGLMKGYVQR